VSVALLVAMALISVGIGFGLSRLVLQPIRLIRETAMRIGSDNLGERIPVSEVKDELSDLALLLNRMFDRLETSFDQIRRFSADASHELKTPLSLVRLHAEKLLVDGQLTSSQEDAIHVQLEEIGRLNAIIDDMLFLSRTDIQAVKMTLLLQDTGEFMRSFLQDGTVLAEYHQRQLSFFQDGDHQIAFEAKWLRQVMMNLLVNAIHASPTDGKIELHSTFEGQVWRIRIENDGPRLTAGQRERMFERFVRLNPADDKGSGLGLAICRSIVALHGGQIYATNRTQGGLHVCIEVPLASS
jgi:two-component system heavy metal sensor histidine kinase CusS